ncbi:TetR/AcrR family transcriptional regulator [Gordonia soli]|uniref:Putative TetR family transcriptional regulator n=1 Tax=Gordonia soli NBRC 108243 TaxID=1223545 RepID=M0QHT1_9ACTN|nr:TetR/AcrR family transcriptional regulator [Gordonia soli]GAC67999.1 putative TetR family transcriptional regulator [Gordonia soli NBRC 108243]
MTATDEIPGGSADTRMLVVAESIRLFAEQGYEATSVDQIAAAAGVSRRTLFRQFHSKEGVIFADHEELLAQVGRHLVAAHGDAPMAVCDAAELVFRHFLDSRDMAARRMRVVQQVPALRDRELVTTYRYQRAFEDYLRRELPDVPAVRIVGFAAAVTGAHNYLLRSMIRGDADATLEVLRAELARLRSEFGVDPDSATSPDRPGRAVAVVTFDPSATPTEIGRQVREQLEHDRKP